MPTESSTGHVGVPRSARLRTLLLAVLSALALCTAALLVWTAAGPGTVSSGARQLPDRGGQHIAEGEPHAPYNSRPPTSGPHYAEPVLWGIYDYPIADEYQVHNLEHGGVLVQYDCPRGCPALVARLEEVVRRYPSKVILAPYPSMETRIALTAWTWIDQFDVFDEARIVAFIEAHRGKGPEQVPD